MISAFQSWDMVSALNELKNIATSTFLEDEAYFNFFKANITFYSWKQVDSTHENTSMAVIDSAVKYYEYALSLDASISFPRLYVQSSQSGLDSCALILSRYAKMYFMNEDYLQAMKYYDKILDFRTDAGYYTSAGLTAFKLTSYSKAELYLNQALSMKPKDEKSWVILTEVYKHTQDTAKAITTSYQAMLSDTLNPNLLLNYFVISSFFNSADHLRDAVGRMEKFHPQSDKLATTLGNYYLVQKEFSTAEPHFLALSKKVDDASVMLKLYYNWYLHLIMTDMIQHPSGNSMEYVSQRNKAMSLIKEKIKPYRSAKSKDPLVQTILQYFAQEFDY
jgi:tetratricopeptide (TPR) repeat protein